ncbi:Developmentally-regulated GTP-binding protein 2 [Naganishia vaughanmartiniae]|uniref:Developmentally-regulated GTP-binding protein 2 n=1 Tax=Naganishia vaughanmartiniae TaxID=1424756 RepID=A0ACC2XL20_9TREE|nr:Developmentally-regulated GTP-binding protein 2 [Naganishia vaughanmartiniae]
MRSNADSVWLVCSAEEAKLAKYRAQLLEPDKKAGGKGEGFDVLKSGDARVALIGFPSVGKSTLLSKVTKTESITGAYEFTTLTAIPGVLEYEGARVQLLDLPGIVEGAAMGRGRGRQVVSVAKTADVIVIMMDATKSNEQRRLLETELEAVGIRLNTKAPDVVFRQKAAGGINATVKLNHIDEKMIRSILQSYKIHNCDVMIREDIDTDEFIDVLLGTRKYIPCLYVFNKIDSVSLEEVERLSMENEGRNVMISCELDLGLDILLERIWEELRLVKVYTKRRGALPDLSDPICLRPGATIETVCHSIHRGLASHFKYALVWGKSSKFSPQPQKVGITHAVTDEDVVSIFTK